MNYVKNNQQIRKSINQSINQTIEQSINRSIERSINQSIDQYINTIQNLVLLCVPHAHAAASTLKQINGDKNSRVIYFDKNKCTKTKN